jgi:shikimate kinase
MGSQQIEIVGVAGTGKSTLARALADGSGKRIADSLHTKSHTHWAYVAHGLPRVLPLVVRSARARPAFDWEEVKFLIYVMEWRRFLGRNPHSDSELVVLDQGPVFALARLLWSRKPITETEAFRHWLDEMAASWSEELDGIVWLEAPEHVLLERINERTQKHEAKGLPTSEALAVLHAHESAYAELFARFAELGGPPLFSFDTSVMSASSIASELERALNGSMGARPAKAGHSQ